MVKISVVLAPWSVLGTASFSNSNTTESPSILCTFIPPSLLSTCTAPASLKLKQHAFYFCWVGFDFWLTISSYIFFNTLFQFIFPSHLPHVSAWIFSTSLSIPFLWYQRGEFIKQSRLFPVFVHFDSFFPHNLNVWLSSVTIRRNWMLVTLSS